jgi:phosphoglycerol transferase
MVLAPPASDTGLEGDWMQARYVVPHPLEAPARKRNLLLVYAESLEASFSQGAFSGHALLAPLDEDKLPGLSFPLFLQAPGTGWTIAGMVASQCGVPLKPLGVFGENLLGEMASGFLPRARCLGDVLKDSGYRNVFLGGASAAFAGKARFLRTHGYDEVRGREDWAAAHPALAMNDWGADDDFLFDQALQRLRELKATGQPFNLTLLTLGLHPPAGYLSPRCERPHGDMRDAVLCTAALIRRFLDAAHEQHLLDDTVVLVVGDHLSARSELSPGLQTVDDRTIYNRLSTPEPVVANRAKIDHFDLYPTLLAALGFQLGDGGLALGCSAIGTVGCRSLVDDPTAVAGLRRRSATYESLWSGAATEDDADD